MVKLNENEKDYTLQCKSPDEKLLDLNESISELGNVNLIDNFLDDSDKSLNFIKIDSEVKEFENLKVYNHKNSSLSAGVIVVIIVSCVTAVLIVAIAAILLRRSPKGKITNQSRTSINISKYIIQSIIILNNFMI